MKKKTSLKVVGAAAVGFMTVAGCASSHDDGIDDSSSSVAGGKNVAVVEVDDEGVASFVVGNLGAAPGTASLAAGAVADPLRALAPQFHLDPANLVLKSAERDGIGDTHYRYAQRKNGRDVIGAELILHARGGNVYAANGTVREDLVMPVTSASLSEADALSAVENASRRLSSVAIAPSADLVYLQRDDAHVLVYRVDLTGIDADLTPVHDTVLVDAATGEIAFRIPHIFTAERREVHDAKNGTTLPGAVVRSEGAVAVSDAVVNGNYDNLGNTYDCYKQLFQRDSYDNAGAKFISSIHYSRSYNNAFWDGTQMVYGDGDGTTLANLPITADVTSHELTHAVTGATSNLAYTGESGGLNEGISDIFGNTCEWFGKGRPAVPDAGTWLVGEDCYTPGIAGDALRYMNDPAKDGASLDYYPDYKKSVDVHYSSGIPNLAFYLLAHGGVHPRGKTSTQVAGIGIEKAAQIFYRANTTIFTSSTTFASARTGTEQAATQLGYGADVVASVSAAWAAVGVGKATQTPDAGVDAAKDSGNGNDAGTACAHSQCTSGGVLSKTCDPCVTKICAADSYCCTTAWDGTCVAEVLSVCNSTCK